MATRGPAPGWPPQLARGSTEEATAAGIYGVIVSAAVMAASHAPTAVATVVAVLVTLTIYWGAERYSRIVAERIHQGHRPPVGARCGNSSPAAGRWSPLRCCRWWCSW